jgi:uncharacterized RDD family membrane protein YckC
MRKWAEKAEYTCLVYFCRREEALMMRADVARGATATRPAAVRRASIWLRLAAYLVDWLVIVIVGSTLVSIGALQLYISSGETRHDAPDASIYAFFVIAALTIPVWVMMTLTSWSWYGRSIGKLAMGLRIVDHRGRPPGLLRGIARLFVFSLENVALLLAPAVLLAGSWLDDALPGWVIPLALAAGCAGLAALLPALLFRGGRPLHDLAAGTVVVEE